MEDGVVAEVLGTAITGENEGPVGREGSAGVQDPEMVEGIGYNALDFDEVVLVALALDGVNLIVQNEKNEGSFLVGYVE